MKIVAMTPAHLPALEAIQNAAYPEDLREPLASLAARQALAEEFCFVALIDGEIAAYLIAHPWEKDRSPGLHATLEALPEPAPVLHLHDMAVSPDHQGKGLAGALLKALIDAARNARFQELTLVAVGDARTYWEKKRFRAHHPVEGYDENALFMIRTLEPD